MKRPTPLQVANDIATRLRRGDAGTPARAKQFAVDVQDIDALRVVTLALLDDKPKRIGRPEKPKPDTKGVYDLDAYIEKTPEQRALDLAHDMKIWRAIEALFDESNKGIPIRKRFELVAPKYGLSAGDLKRAYYSQK